MKDILIGLAFIAAIIVLVIGLQFVHFAGFSYFAPKYEQVKRKVFEETPSYVQGKIQDLSNYKFQYDKADSADRIAIRAVVREQFANFNDKYVDGDLLQFLKQTRGY